MTYIYSKHKTLEAAMFALERYFSNAELFDCDEPKIVKLAAGRWGVQVREWLYCY